jgi:hypothetical protein
MFTITTAMANGGQVCEALNNARQEQRCNNKLVPSIVSEIGMVGLDALLHAVVELKLAPFSSQPMPQMEATNAPRLMVPFLVNVVTNKDVP